MAETGLPYALSYVVRSDATLLDGTPMGDLIEEIDNSGPNPPVGHSVNCVHPRILHTALARLRAGRPNLLVRLLSFHANTSDLDPDHLDQLQIL